MRAPRGTVSLASGNAPTLTAPADAGSPGATKMHDIPLTPACVAFAVAFGLALGALVALGL
jgi:hypothetical protein